MYNKRKQFSLVVIDFLPTELKSRFLQIKDIDEHCQGLRVYFSIVCAIIKILINAGQLDNLRDKYKTFFSLCRKNNKPELRDQQYANICQVCLH